MVKKQIVLLLVVLLLFSYAASAYAGDGLIDQVKQNAGNQGESLKQEVDKVGTNIVDFIRSTFAVAAVVFVIWAGFMWFGSHGDESKIAMAKKAFAGFVVCMICVFAAEKIVGGVLGVLGYQIK